jgi:mitochondrial fission protein ELM1
MVPLLLRDVMSQGLLGRGADRVPGWHPEPYRIVLPVREGAPVGERPPVRIFVGTEPGQHRSERVFVWCVERVRDRGRAYEIYLMRDLAGFDRRRWLTGFTNYRFAIPHFAGLRGRAIYNDVDQIYLADPAALFDIDMGGHGFLALSPSDTAVMVMDCSRMGEVWRLEDAQRERRKAIEKRARAVPDLWGPLPREWHARDEEYQPARSKLLHFTTIHTQPWQPFPEKFVYQRNPVGEVWLQREQEADRAGFEVFTRTCPSPAYVASRFHGAGKITRIGADGWLRQLLSELSATSAFECGLGQSQRGKIAGEPAVSGRTDYASLADLAEAPADAWDIVICREGLELVPDEDMPWLVDSLFARASRAVHVEISDGERLELLPDGRAIRRRGRGEFWWTGVFERAGRRHPSVRWQLVLVSPGRNATRVRQGGGRVDGRPPVVWVLTDDKLGHTTQSLGLARALGWPYESKTLRFTPFNRLSNRLLGASLRGLDKRRSSELTPPWPELVISTGRRTAPVARWIGVQSQGRTRLVQLGRKGGERADDFDLVISCTHFGLPLHPRRVETVAPLTAIDESRLREATARWRDLFAGGPRPHVGLIVGGTSALHLLDPTTAARMAREVAGFARSAGGSVYAVTSPRTGAAVSEALRAALADAGSVYEWRPGDPNNPYLGCLAVADVLVVTGDSESMLAEAAATGKPLYIYPVPERRGGLRQRLRAAINTRAHARPRKQKGTVRPQQRLEYLCARLIERAIVHPPRDLAAMHQRLIEAHCALPFGAPLETSLHPPLCEAERVAERVRSLLGYPAGAEVNG